MAKNPLLKKKFMEGYESGLKEGIARSTAFFQEKFKGLDQIDGIGPKTLEKIQKQLGEQYFNKKQ